MSYYDTAPPTLPAWWLILLVGLALSPAAYIAIAMIVGSITGWWQQRRRQ